MRPGPLDRHASPAGPAHLKPTRPEAKQKKTTEMPFSVVFLIGRNLQPGRGVMKTRPAYLMIIRLQSIERRLSLARLGARLSGLLTVFRKKTKGDRPFAPDLAKMKRGRRRKKRADGPALHALSRKGLSRAAFKIALQSATESPENSKRKS